MSISTRKHFRTCNLCEAMCGLVLTVEEGRITDVRGDPEDVFSRGHICPKGPALREVYEDPDRLRQPVRRTPRGWEPVSWEEALSEAATRLGEIRARHGRDAIGVYVGNPVVHNHGAALVYQGFVRALGTHNRFDANSQDANPRLLASMLLYGDQLALPIPDVDRTDYFLVLGANPAASNGSIMTLGDVRGRLHGIRARGGRIVLLDPRRTETAAWCDEHHFIRPGGDAAFLLALLHVLFADNAINQDALVKQTRGLDALRALAARMPPERAAPAVGIEPATIRAIATAFARAPRAVAYGRVGTCQQEFGTVASWLIDAVNIVTGNFDRPGGAMFPTPAVDVAALGRKLVGNHYGRWRSRVRGLPELAGQLPAAVIAEEIETPGEGQLRAFVTLSGNPVLSTPNGERLASALGRLEFMVALDFYINETTRHAHLILPGTHTLEHGHYDVVFHALAVRNTAKYSEPVFAPPAGALEDWEILYELGMRLGGLHFGSSVINRAARLAWRAGLRLHPDRVIDLGLRLGPYGDRLLPFGRGLSLGKLRRAPHGIDLGPLQPCREDKVRTPDRRVDLAPELLVADVARVEKWVDARAQNGLVLIGRRHVRTNNSWMHNCQSLVKGPDRATLLMHHADAARLGLAGGQSVRVRSRTGAVTARVEPTNDIMPGVVSLPHGYGHGAAADTLRVAGPTPGPNINAVTDESALDPLSGTAALNGVPVVVEPISAVGSAATSPAG
ncbi:MAG TPA: molybdopterin-dependent oxidoreductase [Polyangia bacterium]|nr:molybdopterin-dependent oxidoreductase [Polyangia bacterium]